MKRKQLISLIGAFLFLALVVVNACPIYFAELFVTQGVTQPGYYSPFLPAFMSSTNNVFTAISVVLMLATAVLVPLSLKLKKHIAQLKVSYYVFAVAGLGLLIPGLVQGMLSPFNFIVPGVYFLAIIAVAFPDVMFLVEELEKAEK